MIVDVLAGPALGVLGVSFAVGIVVGMTGMGGGALMTPALIMLGIPAPAAVANDLVSAGLTKSVGAAVHWRAGAPDLRLVAWLATGSVPTALVGAWIIEAVGAAPEQERFVTVAIGCALLLTAATYTAREYLRVRRGPDGTSDDAPLRVRPVRTVLTGAFAGLLVGVTSVGSGSLIMVVLLLMYPALSVVRLVGTDLVQAVPLVIAAAISHVIVGGVTWAVLIPLLIGGVPGTFLGARIANRIPQPLLRTGIVVLLSLTGLQLLGMPPAGIGALAGVALLAALVIRRRVAKKAAIRRREVALMILALAIRRRVASDPDQ